MRRLFRLWGGVRFVIGLGIAVLALLFRDSAGDVWTPVLVLLGLVIGVSGMLSVLLYAVFILALPFLYIGVIWLTIDVWDGAWYSDTLRDTRAALPFFWAGGLLGAALHTWYHNKSWFFMVDRFASGEPPTDTTIPELFAFGLVDLTGSPYLAGVTLTDDGIILDRRNFSPVVLPWRWITSVEPELTHDGKLAEAVVAMRNDSNDYLTLTVPWNRELLELDLQVLSGEKPEQQPPL